MRFIPTVLFALVAVVSCQPTDFSADSHNKRQQPALERHIGHNSTGAEDPAGSSSNGKVIIRLASTLSTPAPARRRQSSDDAHDGCSCEPVDDCPIELMDFRFAVGCDHGTVRCCRPAKSKDAEDAQDTKNVKNVKDVKDVVKVVTPMVLVKRPKKTPMCKCKSRKECDYYFRSEEALDRKDDLCPSGMVHCCETGNMGNSKDDLIKGQVVPQGHQQLGNNQFKPIQLPFLKMPHPDTKVNPQTLPVSTGNSTHHKLQQLELNGESITAAPVTSKPLPALLKPTTQQSLGAPSMHQPTQPQQFGAPHQFRPPIQQYPSLAPNSGLNIPTRPQHRPVLNRPYVYPAPVTQFSFGTPFQQQPQQQQQQQQHFPHHFAPAQPGAFGFSPMKRPQGGQQQQHPPRPVPAPTRTPHQQSKPSSGGGFLSSLMNIFH